MSSSPTSPRFAFRTSWHDQIRETGAVDRLKEGRYDQFPLQQTQTLTNNVLANGFNILGNSFFSRGATPGTLDADILLVSKLAPFKNENFALEAGVLACFHAFSHDGARGQLREAMRRCEVPGPFFLHQARAYLQLLILASGIRYDFVPDEVPVLAKALLNVVKEREPEEPLPAIIEHLHHVGKESIDDYLPLYLVEMMLCNAHYKEKLRIKLNELRTSCKWHSAYQLVAGAGQLNNLPAKALLRYALPDRSWWVPWTPNLNRIHEWETRLSENDRYRLVYVLDLEGPDTRGQQRGLLRHSCCGKFSPAADSLPPKNGQYIMDSLMRVVDRAIAWGPEAIGLIVTMCIKPLRVDWQTIERIEAALELRSPDGIRALKAYSRGFEKGELSDKVQACTAVLVTITAAPRLQNLFGSPRDLAGSGCRVFMEAVEYLYKQLYERQASERFALATGGLGRALASATWLHELWDDRFVEDLKGVPSDHYISNAFHILRTGSEAEYLIHRDDLAYCLCLSKSEDAAAPDTTRSPRVSDGHIRAIPLDYDRGMLRDKLCREVREGFSPDEAMACVNQSKKEHPIFVKRLRELITPENNDMLCVNMAAYLSRNHSIPNAKRPAECWRQLLMHKMRQRSPGLLERVGEALPTSKLWVDWKNHLRWLYEDRHLDPEGGLGFTPEKFNAVTVRKMGIGRSVSMSTSSTGSSGGYPYLGRDFGRD
ncbi:hypothetical protein CEP52_011595 [Fusarium oligoseptatum]|uniref:Uncharacterized protein n=1 Tax=Fusarium oligoseptatum TaxID=2604345 RepID=A0A428T2P8_9HYPO|nr:hypothetical protein CEP52_011595 [Fusarium oligoseptatum]